MFGPSTGLLAHQHVVVVDLGCEEANTFAESLFASTMAEIVHMVRSLVNVRFQPGNYFLEGQHVRFALVCVRR